MSEEDIEQYMEWRKTQPLPPRMLALQKRIAEHARIKRQRTISGIIALILVMFLLACVIAAYIQGWWIAWGW